MEKRWRNDWRSVRRPWYSAIIARHASPHSVASVWKITGSWCLKGCFVFSSRINSLYLRHQSSGQQPDQWPALQREFGFQLRALMQLLHVHGYEINRCKGDVTPL